MKPSFLFFFIMLLMGLWACQNQEETPAPNPLEGLTKIVSAEATTLGLQVALWGEASPSVGYQELYFSVTDDEGKAAREVRVSITPMMQMMAHAHSCPYEALASDRPAINLFRFGMAFMMPSGDMGSWYIDVEVKDLATQASETVRLPLEVTAPAEARLKSFESAIDASKIFVSIAAPKRPSVGINDFEIVIHRRNTMMDFPAVEDFTVEITPEMPTMGHGSPNNVNPVHQQNGHYRGKVNFTMTGLWRLHLVIKKGGVVVKDDLFFDMTF
ncbi:MAG: hypothetical protein HC913_09575 [Microscillaceae bacterium]|nr:hypothetical protein [Microscillaceae bacterium]